MFSSASSTVLSSIARTEPPSEQGLAAGEQQTRYCVAQSIRLEGIRELAVLDTVEKRTRVKALMTDYDTRCAAQKYSASAWDAAITAIEPYRRALKLEGMRYISDSGFTDEHLRDGAPAESALSGQRLVQDRMNELDDACESENAEYGEEAFQACLAANRSVSFRKQQ